MMATLCPQVSLLARHTSTEPEKIAKDIQRPKYFDPWQAKEYGIIDRVSLPVMTHKRAQQGAASGGISAVYRRMCTQ